MTNAPHDIRFSLPTVSGRERRYLEEALASQQWSGGGSFSARCVAEIRRAIGVAHGLLTHSCTAALEMAALLADLQPGDEVIMPSFTFVSTANAVALRRAIPVFVDVRQDTLNIDERAIRGAITSRTKAIFVVHYAGICCAMDEINEIARSHGLLVVEDAAQAYLASYKGRAAGTLGDMAAFSFHDTKNVTSGEGGALVTRHEHLQRRAEVIWEKGTDRSRFLRGEVDKYSWVDIGSSYLPSELTAAVLLAQLEEAAQITERRIAIWERYHGGFADIERAGNVRRPTVPPDCRHNGHLYYLLLRDEASRNAAIAGLRQIGISAPFHYVPLHSSDAGRRFGRAVGDLQLTSDLAGRLIRLPLHSELNDTAVDRIIAAVCAVASR